MQNNTGITSDSKLVKPGFIFVAIKGLTNDGNKFIKEVLSNGASTIISEQDVKVPTTVKFVKVNDARAALGEYASLFYGDPSSKLKIIGVTGTKGKTTTVHLIYHLLSKLGKKVAMISSIAAKIGDRELETGFHVTSSDVVSLHKYLKEMVKAGCEYAVIEVSSHGIDQKRIAGVNFEVGVLTNLAPEHLDYHKTFKEYKRVKMSFINSARSKVIAPKTPSINVLKGDFNNMNAEAALEVINVLGLDKQKALRSLSSFELPKGRLEEIPNDKGIRIIVDFAHTPDSLFAALKFLKKEPHRKLISVFGCAGERDPRKRFKMGKISVKYADMSVFTAEDPRIEKINDILNVMARGARSTGAKLDRDFVKIPERGEAIAYALSLAQQGDMVAFFGKGHETSLAYKGYEHPWSDQLAINNFLNADPTVSAVILAAGKGTRMKSKYPKVVHEICGRPMVSYTLQNLRSAGVADIVAVVSFRKNLVIDKIKGAVKIAHQLNPKGGTADAAKAGYRLISAHAETLIVINGDDSAFYTPQTIKRILYIHKHQKRFLTFVSLMKDDPTGLGRVIRGKNGLITKIVEEKDATEDERKINEVNDGLYVFDRKWFDNNIGNIKRGPQGEFYLVDLVKLAIDEGRKMATYTLPNSDEWQGINTPEQLAEANKKMSDKLKNI